MEHFKGVNETERYNNDLLNEIRKTNTLLEQIAQLLQQQIGGKEYGNDRGLQSKSRNKRHA